MFRAGRGSSHVSRGQPRGAASSRSRGSPWRGGRSNFPATRRGRAGSTWYRGRNKVSKGTDEDGPVGRLITEFALEDDVNIDATSTNFRITNCTYVASYSLTDGKPASIIVPGQPAAWKPRQLPAQVILDDGDFLRDPNGARFPRHPSQPTIQALFALNKDFDPSTIDIVGCAMSLGDILRFTRKIDSTFRFDVEMVGNTLFVIRNCKGQLIPDVRGYGHSFLDTFTSREPDHLRATKSHQRAVTYDFDGLKFVVRFECDGTFEHSEDGESTTPATATPCNFSNILATSHTIAMEEAGKIVSQNSIIEIKTRSRAAAPIDNKEHIPRLWIRQIPNFITAYHTKGMFKDVRITAIYSDLLKWEEDHQIELSRFAYILRQLIAEAKRASHLKLELCRTGTGPLQLREQCGEVRQALPDDWTEKWAEYSSNDRDLGRLVDLSSDDDGDTEGEYPRPAASAMDDKDESDGLDEDFSFDFTACDMLCGYCRQCGQK